MIRRSLRTMMRLPLPQNLRSGGGGWRDDAVTVADIEMRIGPNAASKVLNL